MDGFRAVPHSNLQSPKQPMPSTLSLPKKVLFSTVVFACFLLLVEGLLATIPFALGFQQRGRYDQILQGGTTIVCLGDSVTYGYGLAPHESWPARLQSSLREAGAQITVINRAVAGTDSQEARTTNLPEIQKLTEKTPRVIVLLMIGHNDLAGAGWRKWSSKSEAEESPIAVPPRLFRVFRWATSAPPKSTWSNPEREETLKQNIVELHRSLQEMDVQLYLLTYLLPGEGTDNAPGYAQDIALSRALQGKGNEILRALSRTQSIPLIDIESSLDSPPQWDPVWFSDHIHPSAYGSQQIATAVQKYLVSYGELPVSTLQK